jgi:hypothetical protein
MKRRVALVVAVLTVTGCADSATTRSPSPESAHRSQHEAVHAQLCQVAASAVAGDQSGTRGRFFDRIHQPLHDLAADVAAVDRSVAAELHHAKQAAEAELRAGRLGHRELERLADAAARAVAATGGRARSCTGSEPGAPATAHQQE